MSEGVETIAGLGAHTARITLSARYHQDYNISSGCDPAFSLMAAAQVPDVQRALDNPAIDVFMITAYDGVTWGDCQNLNFLNPDFFTASNTAAVVQEYSDLTAYLYRTYRRSRKRFIISNWESDNSVYCGEAYQYATVDAFRAFCRAQYAGLGIRSPEDALEGLKLWLKARAQGIIEGRRRAQMEAIGGIRVYIAPEFNIVRALRDHNLPSVLYDVLPFVIYDYVSYSAWESINTPDPAGTLLADLDTIQHVLGSNAIIIGESGFPRQGSGGEEVSRTSEVISAALAWGVAYIIQWQLYDTDHVGAFGLYDAEGQPTALAEWFRSRFQSVDGPEQRPAASMH